MRTMAINLNVRVAVFAMMFVGLTACSTVDTTAPADPENPTPPVAEPQIINDWFIWTESSGFKAMPRPSGYRRVFVHDVNSGGAAVGTMIFGAGDGTQQSHAFVWTENDGYRIILTAQEATAWSIDDAGNVAGMFRDKEGTRAFTWSASQGVRERTVPVWFYVSISDKWLALNAVKRDPTGATRIRPTRINLDNGLIEEELPTAFSEGQVLDINANGEAAGLDGFEDTGYGGSSNAVVWDRQGRMTTVYSCLGVSGCFATVRAINNKGVAVGDMRATGDIMNGYTVFRWSSAEGISSFVIPPSRFAVEPTAQDVADDGTILVNNGTPLIIKPDNSMVSVSPSAYTFLNAVAMSRNAIVVGNIPTPR